MPFYPHPPAQGLSLFFFFLRVDLIVYHPERLCWSPKKYRALKLCLLRQAHDVRCNLQKKVKIFIYNAVCYFNIIIMYCEFIYPYIHIIYNKYLYKVLQASSLLQTNY